jgi:O-antigen ligase
MGRSRRAPSKPRPANEANAEKLEESPVSKAVLAGVVTALFVLRPLYPSESVAVEGDGLPVVMLWLLALMLWAILVARGSLVRVRIGWPDFAMALFVLWHSIAALWAVAYESPRPALNMLWEWLGLAIAFFLARQAFSLGWQRRAVAAVMVALAVVVSVYGLYQYSVELPATRASYQQSSDEMLRDAGRWFPPGSPEREAFEQRLASLEPMATFALTNSLAGFLAPWAIVALAICATFARQLSVRQRLVIASLLIPLGLCLLLTKSRSAFLACACGGAAVGAIWWMDGRTRARLSRRLVMTGIAVTLMAATIGGAVIVGGLDVEVLSEAPKSFGYRLQYWQASAAMIRDLPLMGCGPGNYQHRYTAYKLPEASEEIADPHNFVLEVWATAGTPALVAFVGVGIAFCLCILRSALSANADVRMPANGPDRRGKDSAAIFLGAFVGMLLSVPVGAMSAAPTHWLVPFLGSLLGAGTLLMLRPWISRGDDSPILWTIAAATLLIHLLFSGGIAFPGVSGSLWLLAALALNGSNCGEREVPPRTGTAVLCGSLLLIVTCNFTGYQPTLAARTLIQRAFAGDGDPQKLVLDAAKADPWAADPRKYLVDAVYQQVLVEPNAAYMAQFDRAVQQTLTLAPRAASLYYQFGVAYCELYRKHGDRDCLAKGIRLLESAVLLYPNDCRKRADLAVAYLLAGDRTGYEREGTEALRLDRATPHADKRLVDEQRQGLTRNIHAPDVRAPVPP